MAMYLSEWLEHKRIKGTELADQIGCSRSLVSKWVTKSRALTNITWINKICEFLNITPEQLAQKPPKSSTSVIVSKGVESHSEHTADVAVPPEGIEMIEKRVSLHESLEELPDELLDTAASLINRLKGLAGGRSSHPTKRGNTKS
jgi:DNA-binding Xre family transcriptional regulator